MIVFEYSDTLYNHWFYLKVARDCMIPFFYDNAELSFSVTPLYEYLEPLPNGRNLACENLGLLAGICCYNNTQDDTVRSNECHLSSGNDHIADWSFYDQNHKRLSTMRTVD